jgi:N-formylglutamate amidohydrolase
MSWWYAFRQIDPKPPGGWVIDYYGGPHASHHDALMAVERADMRKQRDEEYSYPFEAATKEEAQRLASEGKCGPFLR